MLSTGERTLRDTNVKRFGPEVGDIIVFKSSRRLYAARDDVTSFHRDPIGMLTDEGLAIVIDRYDDSTYHLVNVMTPDAGVGWTGAGQIEVVT